MAAQAQVTPIPFAVSAVPSRFEIHAAAGERVVRSVSLRNVGDKAIPLRARTLDWTMDEKANIQFIDGLTSDSCRPWVAVERREFNVEGSRERNFRFQIDVPKQAPAGECRFMLAIESVAPAAERKETVQGREISMPVGARLALPVYVVVGGAAPKLTVLSFGVEDVRGQRTPVIRVRNSGNAHGRLEGSADAVDAKGTRFEIAPDASAVLPGQTRSLALAAQPARGQKPYTFVLPITVKGSFDSDSGAIPIDARFE